MATLSFSITTKDSSPSARDKQLISELWGRVRKIVKEYGYEADADGSTMATVA